MSHDHFTPNFSIFKFIITLWEIRICSYLAKADITLILKAEKPLKVLQWVFMTGIHIPINSIQRCFVAILLPSHFAFYALDLYLYTLFTRNQTWAINIASYLRNCTFYLPGNQYGSTT